jgi:hypothetical protein
VVAGSGLGPRTVSLQADRAGNGKGRSYAIVATAADEAGNVASATATCIVPHDQGP